MPKYIISGGGTGGHIFPAIAIADQIKREDSQAEILFVGAKGKMEMERVPKAGYRIEGLDIRGIQRKLTLKNLLVPFKLVSSLLRARKIIKDFKPDAAIGVGGYASGPLLRVASWMGVPTLLQEQNSYPGITNKLLAKKADSICVAYPNMDRFFDKKKIKLSGNPVRSSVVEIKGKRDEAYAYFDLDKNKPTLLVVGGSLGARSMNQAMQTGLDEILGLGLQVIWQTGRFYFEDINSGLGGQVNSGLSLRQFIDRMDLAYAAADIVLSRAGALSISELCLIGKPVILVPSPNVSEDHQTKNAMALVEKEAAVLLRDNRVIEELPLCLMDLMKDETKRQRLGENIRAMAHRNAAATIVEEIHRIRR